MEAAHSEAVLQLVILVCQLYAKQMMMKTVYRQQEAAKRARGRGDGQLWYGILCQLQYASESVLILFVLLIL